MTQRDDRRHFLGSTDIAAILGKSPWRSALDVYLEKVAEEPPEPLNKPIFDLGLALEPYAAKRYCAVTGHKVRRMKPVHHKKYPFLRAQIDYRVLGRGGLELKSADYRVYSRMVRMGLPEHYIIQGQMAAAVAGFEHYDWAVLNRGNGELLVFPQDTDQIFGRDLINKAVAFWYDHVEARVPPVAVMPPLPDDLPDIADARPLDEDQGVLVARLQEARSLRKESELIERAAKDQIITKLGKDWGTYYSDVVRVTYAERKGRVTVDTKALLMVKPIDRTNLAANLVHEGLSLDRVKEILDEATLDIKPFLKHGHPWPDVRVYPVREEEE